MLPWGVVTWERGSLGPQQSPTPPPWVPGSEFLSRSLLASLMAGEGAHGHTWSQTGRVHALT